jgi:hypothetical protein
MSGSLPHSIAVASHTLASSTTPGYTTFDLRSDEDNNMAALNARNAKASSDLIVTISEEGQALAQRNKKKFDDVEEKKSKQLLEELEEEFIDDDPVQSTRITINKQDRNTQYDEDSTGSSLDQIV